MPLSFENILTPSEDQLLLALMRSTKTYAGCSVKNAPQANRHCDEQHAGPRGKEALDFHFLDHSWTIATQEP